MASNVLVVDFSYIMYPIIRVYKDRVDINENSTVVWHNLKELYGLDTNLVKYDATAYRHLVELICSLPKDISYDVTTDMRLIAQEMANSDEVYNIVNIDYFDDMEPITRSSNKVNDLNWVRYLYNKDKVENYKWVSTCTSTQKNNYPDNSEVTRVFNFDDITFDRVVVVLSPHFVPYEYKTLFDVLQIILDSNSKTNEEEV